MIVKLTCPITYDANDVAHVTTLSNPINQHWNKPSTRTKTLKAKIRQLLDAYQSHCAYCGLELGGTSAGAIEHIAPKGRNRHPEFTFEAENLVLACDFCNGSKKKFQKETIAVKNIIYNQCHFLIVHPYYDIPDNHYSWVDNVSRIVIQSSTPKATASIKMFELDSPKMTKFRAMQFNSYVTLNNLTLDRVTENQLKTALAYK